MVDEATSERDTTTEERAVAVVDAGPSRRAGCPKTMVLGPCGGVRDDGGCEVDGNRCSFLDEPVLDGAAPGPPRPTSGRSELLDRAAERPVVLTDLTVHPFDPASVRAVTAVLADSCDAVLVGEHSNRTDLPGVVLAGLVREAGSRAWVTLACRDRNRVALESDLAGLAATGAADGVLCVTGDARRQGVRADVPQVFDLDGPRLAALAALAGLPVAVPEAPEAPPCVERPRRLLTKQHAGASLAVLNHVSTPARVAAFVAAARAAGVTLPVVAGVAVYTDERSARVLQNFPGLHLDAEAVEQVLCAPDPAAAGIAAAVAEARALLTIDGVAGVNLSGLASDRGVLAAAEVKAAVGRELLGVDACATSDSRR